MALCKINSIPGICSDYLYCQVNNCLCGCMHLKTSRTSSADSHVHLEVSIDFCNIAFPKSFQFMITNFVDPPFYQIECHLRHPQIYGTIGIHISQGNNHWQYIQTVEHFLHDEKIKAIVTVRVAWITQRNVHSIPQELDHLTLAYRYNKPIWVFPKWLSLNSANSVNHDKIQEEYGY